MHFWYYVHTPECIADVEAPSKYHSVSIGQWMLPPYAGRSDFMVDCKGRTVYFMELGVCLLHHEDSSSLIYRLLLLWLYRSCFSGPAEPSVTHCVNKKSKSKGNDDDAFEAPGSSGEDLKPGDRTTLLILSSGGNSSGMVTKDGL